MRALLGSSEAVEFEAPGVVPRPIALPPGVDPYWAELGDCVGWELLNHEEWPRRDGADRPAETRPPDVPTRGWNDAARRTWPRPTAKREPVGLVPWEVLADLRYYARLARVLPQIFHAFPEVTAGTSRPADLVRRSSDKLASEEMHALLKPLLDAVAAMENPLELLLKAPNLSEQDRARIEIALASLLGAVDGFAAALDGAQETMSEFLYRVARSVRIGSATQVAVPSYSKPARGRPPTDALVVHAAVHLLRWKRTCFVAARNGEPKVKVLRRINRTGFDDEVEFLAWLIPAALALERDEWIPKHALLGPRHKATAAVDHWRKTSKNYLAPAKTAKKEV